MGQDATPASLARAADTARRTPTLLAKKIRGLSASLINDLAKVFSERIERTSRRHAEDIRR